MISQRMERADLDALRGKVSCCVVLEKAGFALDVKESTRKAAKYRRAAEIIIVIHEGRGWFDPLGDAKGDVFALVEYLEGARFVDVIRYLAELVSFVPSQPLWRQDSKERLPDRPPIQRWTLRDTPRPGSATWRYLCETRGLPERILRMAVSADILREGPHGSMWAAHTDNDGALTGWEERGPQWRGFASGGKKSLFRLGPPGGVRLCVTEAAIDVMSLASLEGVRGDSLYVSTAGGWSPVTARSLRELALRTDTQLVAATDANRQGNVFAERLRDIAKEVGCGWQRLTPPGKDWNDVLRERRGA